jgi:hypothetical protein
MGKVKQGKRLSAHRSTGDPIGVKVPLADEIESLKLAKSKSTELINKNGQMGAATSGAAALKKRQAEEDEVKTLNFFLVFFLVANNFIKI